MQWQNVQQNWPAFVESVMQRWPQTEEADLLELDGNRDALVAYLGRRHDLTRAEADEQIALWTEGAVPSDIVMDEEMDDAQTRASAAHIPPGEDVYAEDRDFGDDMQPDAPIERSR